MHGLQVLSDLGFDPLFKPLLPVFQRLYWYLEFQGGSPFDRTWLYAGEENERLLERYRVDAPGLHSDASLWRPGTLPALASRLAFDEWSYLTGFEAGKEQAQSAAGEFASSSFKQRFSLVQQYGGILLIYIAGDRWEVYPARREWSEELEDYCRARGIESSHIDSSKWNKA